MPTVDQLTGKLDQRLQDGQADTTPDRPRPAEFDRTAFNPFGEIPDYRLNSDGSMKRLPDESICPTCAGLGQVTVDTPGHALHGKNIVCPNPDCAVVKYNRSRILKLFASSSRLPDVYEGLNLDTWASLPRHLLTGKQHATAAVMKMIHAGIGKPFSMSEALEYLGIQYEVLEPNFQSQDRAEHHERLKIAGGITMKQSYGASLGFFGDYGTGKTGLAAAAARKFFSMGVSVHYVRIPDLIKDIQDTYDDNYNGLPIDQIVAPIAGADLVILDEFGVPGEKAASDKQRIIQDFVVNPRWKEKKPVIFTTNHNPDSFWGQWGGQAASRLYEMCHLITFYGGGIRSSNYMPG